METPFGITREEILELAAVKLADQFGDAKHLSELAEREIEQRVKSAFESGLQIRIDEFLGSEMEKLLSQEICPVDIWGDKTGSPTTIRAQLAARAKDFWDVKVDQDGKSQCYGGNPRHEVLFKKIVKDEFDKAVKENCTEIVAAFKQALKVDAARITSEHIDKLIKTR